MKYAENIFKNEAKRNNKTRIKYKLVYDFKLCKTNISKC